MGPRDKPEGDEVRDRMSGITGMKRTLTAALALSLTLSLAACAPKSVETDAETADQTPTAADCAALRVCEKRVLDRCDTCQ